MAAPKNVQSPEKELRFTRSAQGLLFLILCMACVIAALAILVLSTQGTEFERPRWEGYEWTALFPIPPAILFFRYALRCIRHAYLILTPLGIEIFPLFRPEKHMALITWQEIQHMEFPNAKTLILHRDAQKTSGIVLSLAPILPAGRALLRHTIDAILLKREKLSTS